MITPNIPEKLTKLRDQFLEYWQSKRNITYDRLKHIKGQINGLYVFMINNNINEITDITQKEIIQYQYYLYKEKKIQGQTVMYHFRTLNTYCRYLYHENLIWKNPFTEIHYINPPEPEEREITRRYSFEELITSWINWMKKLQYHVDTVNMRHKGLLQFISYLRERDIKTVYKITPQVINEYKEHLTTYQYKPGAYYSPFMQVKLLHDVCCFLLYLDKHCLIKANPAKHIAIRKYFRELEQKCRKETIINPKLTKPYFSNPEMDQLFEKFNQYRLSRGQSPGNAHNYIIALRRLNEYMKSIGITELRKIMKHTIMDFQTWLYSQTTKDGRKYSQNTLHNNLICIRGFFRYLTKYDYLVCDPTSSVDLPKSENGLPRTCMDEREVKIMLDAPDISKHMGIRDKAILEVLYSTGLRSNELINVKITDIDFAQGLIRVDRPKGGKSYQRIVPIGAIACKYTKVYLEKVRPLLDKDNGRGYLFLSDGGFQLFRSGLRSIVCKYFFKTGIRKQITTHSFRVSCATHMLTHGADIRYVQQQLGHLSIRTTQGYTRLVPKDLKRAHKMFHPREKQAQVSDKQNNSDLG